MAIMMNRIDSGGSVRRRMIMKVLLVQFMLSLCFFTSVASGLSQHREVSLTFKEESLSKALKSLGEATDCKFIFNYDDLNRYQVTAELINKNVQESLDILLKNKPFKYTYEGEFIVISFKEDDKKETVYLVKGVVKDETGLPLPGVTVVIKGTQQGAATDVNGKFELKVKEKNTLLVFSFIGMKGKEIGRAHV